MKIANFVKHHFPRRYVNVCYILNMQDVSLEFNCHIRYYCVVTILTNLSESVICVC